MIRFVYLYLTKQIYKEFSTFHNNLENVLDWANGEKIKPVSLIKLDDENYCLLYYRWARFRVKKHNKYDV